MTHAQRIATLNRVAQLRVRAQGDWPTMRRFWLECALANLDWLRETKIQPGVHFDARNSQTGE